MEQGCTSRHAKLIDRLVIEDLPPSKMGALRDHLAACPACQQRYNRVVLASRLLDGGPDKLDQPSQRELAWVEHAVLERTRLVPDSQPVRRSVLRWVVGLAGAAAALAIVLPLALRSGPPPTTGPRMPSTEFQARGGVPARVSRQVGVRAFCVQQQRGGLEPVVVEAKAGPACHVDDVMRFAYTNRSKMSHLFLVGLDEKYGIKWYEPHPPNRTSIKVRQDVANEPLSRAVKLSVNHTGGRLRLFAVFSDTALHAEEIKRAVEQVKRQGIPVQRMVSLPVDNTEQRSLLVNLSSKQ